MNKKTYVATIFCIVAFFWCIRPLIAQEQSAMPEVKTVKFRVGAHIGYGYIFKNLSEYYDFSPAILEYLSKLRNNFCFGADMLHYFGKYAGFGFKYNALFTKAELQGFDPSQIPDGTGFIMFSSEKNWVHFLGPFLALRYMAVPNKHSIFANLGAGYVCYRSKIDLLHGLKDKVYTENSAAFFVEAGYDFIATKSFAIGVQVSTYVDILGLTANYDNTVHLDVTLGLRFYK